MKKYLIRVLAVAVLFSWQSTFARNVTVNFLNANPNEVEIEKPDKEICEKCKSFDKLDIKQSENRYVYTMSYDVCDENVEDLFFCFKAKQKNQSEEMFVNEGEYCVNIDGIVCSDDDVKSCSCDSDSCKKLWFYGAKAQNVYSINGKRIRSSHIPIYIK